MDHHGGNYMAIAILAAVLPRTRTGEGQWIDMSCTEAGATLTGPEVLDWSVNGRSARRPGMPSSNRSQSPAMAPHGIYPARGDDEWVALACRDDADWVAMARVVDEPWTAESRWETRDGRLQDEDRLDAAVAAWTRLRDRFEVAASLVGAGVPASVVARPEDRIEHDSATSEFGLWPIVHHPLMGDVRVDGLPLHLSETDWALRRGAPCLGEHNDMVFGALLGVPPDDLAALRRDGVI